MAVIYYIIIICVILVLLVCLAVFANRYQTVAPNQAMVVFGKKYADGFDVSQGGGRFIWPILERYEFLHLDVQTLDITVPSVVTDQGVQLFVEAVAQVKISSEDDLVRTAAEQLLNKPQTEVNDIATRSLEGHVRGVCAQLTVEEINSDRNKVASKIQNVAVSDLNRMGLHVVSFTIRSIRDDVGYLDAMGMTQTAKVKRDAAIGRADADRDADIGKALAEKEATIVSAEAEKEGETAKAVAHAQIAEAIRDRDLKVAKYQEEVKRKEADRDIAYSIQKSTKEQELVEAQMGIKIREKLKAIDLEQQEIERREKELEATVRRPARAEADKHVMIADGMANAAIKEGKAEADVVTMKGKAQADVRFLNGQAEANVNREKGTAEADVISAKGLAIAEALKAKGLAEAETHQAKGLAEAMAMDKKAEAWKKYGEAAIASMVIEKLPEVAGKLAPLENTEKIIIMGGNQGPSSLVQDSVRSMVELTSMMKGLTGIDLEDTIKGFIPEKEEKKSITKKIFSGSKD